MTNLREAAQMALDALEWCYDVTEWPANGKSPQDKSIEALRAALAQPEQIISQEWQQASPDAKLRHYSLVLRDLDKTIEGWCEQPEFYLDGKRIDVERLQQWSLVMKDGQKVPMDLTHREWVGLTDEEINTWNIAKYKTLNDFIRSLEAKLKEKNAC